MEEFVLKDKTILVVDDEKDLREIVSSELEYMGAKVLQAENVAFAKSLVDQHRIDLVISDIRMPGETGIDLLRYIKSKNLYAPPVILITGFADISSEVAFDLGTEAILSKPFKLDELIFCAEKLTHPSKIRFSLHSIDASKKFSYVYSEDLNHQIQNNKCLIGRGGMTLLVSMHKIDCSVGDLLNFSIKFSDTTLNGVGICRWLKSVEFQEQAVLGMEFVQLSDETYKLIEKYLNEHKTVPFIPSLN